MNTTDDYPCEWPIVCNPVSKYYARIIARRNLRVFTEAVTVPERVAGAKTGLALVVPPVTLVWRNYPVVTGVGREVVHNQPLLTLFHHRRKAAGVNDLRLGN